MNNGNGDSFFESLEKLNQFIKAEWVKQGNKLELYERAGIGYTSHHHVSLGAGI